MAKSIYTADAVFGGTTEAPATTMPTPKPPKTQKEIDDEFAKKSLTHKRFGNMWIPYRNPMQAAPELPSRDDVIMGVFQQELEAMEKKKRGGLLGGLTADLGGGGDLGESVESLLFGV